MIGRDDFFDPVKVAGDTILQSDEETGIFNEFFLVVNEKPIDVVDLSVTYLEDKSLHTVQKSIPVNQYKTKNNYTFPVKGVWQVSGNYDCWGAHRTQYSMEFALDVVQLDAQFKNTYNDDMSDEDYVHFGQPILAIADGEVVDCFNDSQISYQMFS